MKREQPGFGHLKEPLHVLIECEGSTEEDAKRRIGDGVAAMEKLLIPVDERNDILKREQLRQLAAMRGGSSHYNSSLITRNGERIDDNVEKAPHDRVIRSY